MAILRRLMNEFRRTLKAKLALAASLRESMHASASELERLYGRDMKVAFVPSVVRHELSKFDFAPVGSVNGSHQYRHKNGSTIHIELQDVGNQDPHMHWAHRSGTSIEKGVGGFDLIQHLRSKCRV